MLLVLLVLVQCSSHVQEERCYAVSVNAVQFLCAGLSVMLLGRGWWNRRLENLGIAKIGSPPPPPYPNPGTLVDLTTKARKCDSRHFDVKSA